MSDRSRDRPIWSGYCWCFLSAIGLCAILGGAGCGQDPREDPSPTCGDGVIDPGEDCDGLALGGQTCAGLGYAEGGTLGCTATCGLDVSGCLGARCGNGVIDPGEACDASDLGGETCTSLGFHDGGELACAADCRSLDLSGCQGGYCGDEIINGPEICDGDDLSGMTCTATCQDYGYYAGHLSCTDTCTLDPSTCEERCGDGLANGPEACDGTDFGGTSCASLGYHGGGSLLCSSDCMEVDPSGCEGGLCGDGVINGPEACDGSDLGGLGCDDLGHLGGELACTSGCELDQSGCHDDQCGDGVRTGLEACDASDLGGATCADLGYYGGGVLECAEGCTFASSGCLGGYCGDGLLNGPEACEGGDLGGATCADFGLLDGILGCDAACQHDTSGCLTGWVCGDVLVDDRDGRSYDTVALGGLCWMATNLDVGARIDTTSAQTDNAQLEKYCFLNDPTMCATYGGLYQWDEMMQYSTAPGARGICPEGWRVPTDPEWKALEIAAGMDPIVADQDQWRGPPAGTALRVGGGIGFDALLGGMVSATGVSYNYPAYGYYWTSTMGVYSMPWRRCLTSGPSYPPDTVGRWDTWPRSYALSLRCVRDL